MKASVLLLGLLVSHAAIATEVVNVKGLANARAGSKLVDQLYYEAKADGISQIPFGWYRQTTEWKTYFATVGPQTYVGAEASFEEIESKVENGFIYVNKSRHGKWTESEVAAQESLAFESAVTIANLNCSSAPKLVPPYQVRKRNLPDRETVITVSARFQCAEAV